MREEFCKKQQFQEFCRLFNKELKELELTDVFMYLGKKLKDPRKEKSPEKGSKLNKRMNLKHQKLDDTLDSREGG